MTDTLPPPSNAMEMVWRLVRSGSQFEIARVSDVEEAIRAYAAAAVQAERERRMALAEDLHEYLHRVSSQVPMEHAAWAQERGAALLAALRA